MSAVYTPALLLCIVMGMDCVGDLHPVHRNASALQLMHHTLNTLHPEHYSAGVVDPLCHCCALQWEWIALEICTPCMATLAHCNPCITP